eukprot:1902236-Alexandrium_andersonii.AAC.1
MSSLASGMPKTQGLRGLRIGGLESAISRCVTSDPVRLRFRWQIRNLLRKCRRTHPSAAPGTTFE